MNSSVSAGVVARLDTARQRCRRVAHPCRAGRSRRARAASAPSACRGPSRSSARRWSRCGRRAARRGRARPSVGETSRPSVNAWIHVRSAMPSRCASSSSARRWSMCEWTPPWETRPSRCTSPPALARAPERRDERLVLEERCRRRSRGSRAGSPGRARGRSRSSGGRPRSCPSARREARRPRPRRRACVCGYSAHSRSNTGVVGELDRVPRTRRRAAPPVEDDERYERERAAASHIATNESMSSDAPPTSAPSTSGCASSSAAFSGFTEPP